MDELNGNHGLDKDGVAYVFGRDRRCTKLTQKGIGEHFQYKEISCLPNQNGYKVEWKLVREDNSETIVYIYGLQHNVDLLEQRKEEVLWES